MPRSRFTRLMVLLVSCLASVSCKPDVSFVTWEKVDPQGAFYRMSEVTGHIEYVETDPMQQYLGTRMGGYTETGLTIAATLAKLAESAGVTLSPQDGGVVGDPEDEDEEATPVNEKVQLENSTNLYLDIACPGEDGHGVGEDFENGYLRIVSDDLSDFSFDDLEDGAHMLLTFEECVLPGLTLEGSAPAYMLGGFTSVLIDVQELGLGVGGIRAVFLNVSFGKSFRLLLDVSGEGTYRLDASLDDDEVTVAAVTADGTAECEFGLYGNYFQGCDFSK